MNVVLNVGRSRLTILSISLALFLFATTVFLDIGDQMRIRATWVFLTSFVAITIGFCLSMLSLLLFLLSQRLDEAGGCEIWTFSCAELLMYLALAQTMSGGLGTYVAAIAATLGSVPRELQLAGDQTVVFRAISGSLAGGLRLATGLVWGVFVYACPTVFLLRNPLAWRRKRWLAAGYAVVLLFVFWVSATAYHVKAHAAGRPSSLGGHMVRQMWQPALWQLEARTLPARPLTSEP